MLRMRFRVNNIMWEIFLFKHHAENWVRKTSPKPLFDRLMIKISVIIFHTWSRDMLNFNFFIKGFVTSFSTTLCVCFFKMLLSVNRRNFIVWLPLLPAILDNMYMVIICFPVCDAMNSEVTLAFLSSRFPKWLESQDKALNILRRERTFNMK